MSEQKKSWVIRLAEAIGFLAGIILLSVGSIILIQSGMRLVFLDGENQNDRWSSYQDIEQDCLYPSLSPSVEKETSAILSTGEQHEICIAEKKENNKKEFTSENIRRIVENIPLIIVGLVLFLAFRKKYNQ